MSREVFFAAKAGNQWWAIGGSNTGGECGTNYVPTSLTSPVALVGGWSLGDIDNADAASCGVNVDGTPLTWGYNPLGNLGVNVYSYSRGTPGPMVGGFLCKAARMGDFPAPNYFTLILDIYGQVWGCGKNASGQLGLNQITTASYSSPVATVGNHSFVTISAGSNTSFGMKGDGIVWSWGFNGNGQLGWNTAITVGSSPQAVVGDHSFIRISAGDYFIVGLKSNGEIWGWGKNTVGELGLGDGNNRSSPCKVVGNHSFISVSAGSVNAYGLKANGEVWAWGSGQSGAMGDGTATGKTSPCKVIGNHSFIEILAGGWSCVALKANGEVWGWGSDTLGKLGKGTSAVDVSSPCLVIGNHSFIHLAGWTNFITPQLAIAPSVLNEADFYTEYDWGPG